MPQNILFAALKNHVYKKIFASKGPSNGSLNFHKDASSREGSLEGSLGDQIGFLFCLAVMTTAIEAAEVLSDSWGCNDA